MRRALLLSTALLLTACGGGDDAKAAYIDDATAICEEAKTEFEALTVPTSPEGFAPYTDQVVGIVEKAEAELGALMPPEEDRAALQDRVLDPLGGLVMEGRTYADQVRAAGDDQTKLLSLLSKRPSAADIDTKYLRSYGLEECADAIEAAG